MNKAILYELIESYISSTIREVGIESLTDEKLEEIIESIMYMPNVRRLEEKDIEEVRNKIWANNSVTMDIGSCIEADKYEYKKWYNSKKAELDMKYWERYRAYLLKDKKFSPKVVDTIDRVTDDLTELLGNPSVEEKFQRRGLIIGDVQSGKTSNYTGLICKAADVGYKVIIVLTGTIEKLRKQTQMRIDEGFIGVDSDAYLKNTMYANTKIGAGKYGKEDTALALLTSRSEDFKTKTARTAGFKLSSFNDSVVFVVKKNVSSLKNLNKWLKSLNGLEDEKINQSLLLVDDESDNASVNTNDEDKNPTTINAQIRILLDTFKKASYVGFTATPFANIFIDPDTNDEMEKEDLFPRDYIYSLNPPNNYIGARNIFSQDGSHNSMLREIDEKDIQAVLPLAHKNGFRMKKLPKSLEKAIRVFLLANAIRDLRGDTKAHRSMLINISRFNIVQQNILELVDSYVKNIQYAVKAYSKLKERALEDSSIKKLKETFIEEYSECEFSWGEIQNALLKAILPIQSLVVNQKSKVGLDYDDYEEGLRVIAIGGLSLSRGLTLEGLIVSYFYRNSKMYDTLMQMGRWFGYRGGYEDLCRLWMHEESIIWYEYISMATDELRSDIKRYQGSNLTPKEFGIKVRSDKTSLLVTARNKMRSADTVKRQLDLSGDVVETVYFDIDKEIVERNRKKTLAFLNEIAECGETFRKKSDKSSTIINSGIEYSKIEEFLENIEISPLNIVDTKIAKEFIIANKENGLSQWDIAVIGGSLDTTEKIGQYEVRHVKRKERVQSNENIIILGSHRLGSANDGMIGLGKEKIDIVKANSIEKAKEKAEEKAKKNALEGIEGKAEEKVGKHNIAQKEYFEVDRKPLLCIYFIDVENNDKINKLPLVGFSIGIPTINSNQVKYVTYTINKIQKQLGFDEIDFDYEDEE